MASRTRHATRRVNTRVLPEPAPARMHNGAASDTTASRWAGLRPCSTPGSACGRVSGRASGRASAAMWMNVLRGYDSEVDGAGPAARDAERPRVAFGPEPSVLLGAAPQGRCLRHRRLSAPGAHGGGPERPSPVAGRPTSDLGAHAARSDACTARGGGLRPTPPGGTDAVALGVDRMIGSRGREVKRFLGLPVTPPRYPR